MRRLACGLMMAVVAVASLVFMTGCDVRGQVLDTIGLAGQITGTWLN